MEGLPIIDKRFGQAIEKVKIKLEGTTESNTTSNIEKINKSK